MELTCPKCHGTMRTYERNGVHVDQCSDCRGIFLDRGELERLVDAENAWHAGSRQPSSGSGHAAHGGAPQGGASYGTSSGQAAGLGAVVNEVLSQVRGQKSSSHGYGHKRKKESFLGDLFG
ncbi:zf-TFIIB domain-containing protein [Geodermatophilus sp. YIM 151500]|uniref:TFIIB-type zinc ribbon-containing protein n=1 Tax=Geodermatophilus sp. YIM 151500 TaxID=2984531 RepID=UPI0021E49DE9|nr:zf-TFIIB domain-containing protein [Geodermatophilus sp. YIM 151500]MCV2487828.1 zf-TFIIB domain-containing protein [Geodermatophilus sp. YIM 151500]